MRQESDTLHLVLKGKWYDMVASGEKKEEYRALNNYYKSGRLLDMDYPDGFVDGTFAPAHPYVSFHRGYTKTTMMFKIDEIRIGKPNPEWCEPEDKDKQVFIIKLGERVK